MMLINKNIHPCDVICSALVSAFEKAKKKYQGRVKKLEGQLLKLTEQYETQVCVTRYLSILSFNILTLLTCTQSVDNLLQTFVVLWENEYSLTSNPLCSFTSVKLCRLVIFPVLIFKKKLESVFS